MEAINTEIREVNMQKSILAIMLLILCFASPIYGGDLERFKLYIVNEARKGKELAQGTVYPSYGGSAFDHNTVIRLDTVTGEAWVLTEIGAGYKSPDGKDMTEMFLDWSRIEGIPKTFFDQHSTE